MPTISKEWGFQFFEEIFLIKQIFHFTKAKKQTNENIMQQQTPFWHCGLKIANKSEKCPSTHTGLTATS